MSAEGHNFRSSLHVCVYDHSLFFLKKDLLGARDIAFDLRQLAEKLAIYSKWRKC